MAQQAGLNEVIGLPADQRLPEDNPTFGPNTTKDVKLPLACSGDRQGMPRMTNDEVGSVPLDVRFGADRIPSASATSDPLLALALTTAPDELAAGVRELWPPSDRGPCVDEQQRRTGLRLRAGAYGYAW